MPQTRPDLTGDPAALFVFSNLREQKFGLTKAWLARLRVFEAAGWDTHVATIHPQPEIDETLRHWRERGLLPWATEVHHYQRRDKRFRPSWNRATDDHFNRDDRIADWLDWLVGRMPGVVVFADSPVTYAPVAMMRNPYVGRVMTLHLVHRHRSTAGGAAGKTAGTLTEHVTNPSPPSEAVAEQSPEGESAEAGQDRAGPGAATAPNRYGSIDGRPKLADRFLPYGAHADVVVALTEGHAAHLRTDLPGVEVRTIPNMVEIPELPAGLVRDPLRVVYLGRLERLKRVDHAIRAAGLAAQEVPGLRMDVYGRGSDVERLVALRDSLGLAGTVEIHGFTQNPDQELATAALSTMTAKREPFGLSVAESLAVGTPVVTYDVNYGPRELITDGINGRVVRAGDVEAFARAMVECLSDRAAWESMSAAGPASIERLNPEVVGKMWLDLAAGVAARVARPVDTILVEDIRVRRGGLTVQGMAFGSPARPGSSLDVGAARVVLEAVESPVAGVNMRSGHASDRLRSDSASDPSVGKEVMATVPWDSVSAWPLDFPLTGHDAARRPVPVIGPGLPVTAAPTERGVVVIGWDPDRGTVRRIPGPGTVAVTGGVSSIRATVGDDVTVLNERPIANGRVEGADRGSHAVVLEVLPGLHLTADSVIAVAAGAGDLAAKVGELRLAGPSTAPNSAPGRHLGTIQWDPAGLAQLEGLGSTGAVLWLAVGRSLRMVGPLELGPGRVLRVRAGSGWVVAPTTTGRAMLVRGRAVRIRVAQASRAIRAAIGR